jgi:hypothetical protein
MFLGAALGVAHWAGDLGAYHLMRPAHVLVGYHTDMVLVIVGRDPVGPTSTVKHVSAATSTLTTL